MTRFDRWFYDYDQDDNRDGLSVEMVRRDRGIARDAWNEFRNHTAEDAHLIAAAPDLLAACKAMIDKNQLRDGSSWKNLRAAIAKAEGRKEVPNDSP